MSTLRVPPWPPAPVGLVETTVPTHLPRLSTVVGVIRLSDPNGSAEQRQAHHDRARHEQSVPWHECEQCRVDAFTAYGREFRHHHRQY